MCIYNVLILIATDYSSPAGFDRTRNAVIGNKDIDLTYLEEAYTTEHWLVRIYRYFEFTIINIIWITKNVAYFQGEKTRWIQSAAHSIQSKKNQNEELEIPLKKGETRFFVCLFV